MGLQRKILLLVFNSLYVVCYTVLDYANRDFKEEGIRSRKVGAHTQTYFAKVMR